MPSKKKKTKPAAEATPESGASVTIDIDNVQFWRSVADQIAPDEQDKWKVGEIATALMLQAGLWRKEYDSMNNISDKCDGMAVSFSVKTDRTSTPPLVKVNGSYSEKHPMKAESDVPDINQTELPGMSAESSVSAEGAQEAA